MVSDTKERILAAALEMFSQNGYAGTSVRELTASLGLVKSSMYKHFRSKDEIWNTLRDELIAYYEARFGSPEHLPPVPESLEELVAQTQRMVSFTVHDEKVVKSRKLLSIEQFRDERARDLATKYFLTGLTEMFTRLFAAMMDKGLLRRDDPKMLAFAYTAPITALIHLCDREPEKTDEAMRQIASFSRHFIKIYRKEYPVRLLTAKETEPALQLAWKVFCEFESPDYAPEGTEEFKKCLNDDAYLTGIRYYGAFDEEKLVGMLGIREEKCHVCFFFVDGECQRLGIGRKLFKRMREDIPGRTITLNSSPNGLPFYKALGFAATNSEKTVNGIRFTPMEYKGDI